MKAFLRSFQWIVRLYRDCNRQRDEMMDDIFSHIPQSILKHNRCNVISSGRSPRELMVWRTVRRRSPVYSASTFPFKHSWEIGFRCVKIKGLVPFGAQ